MRLRRKSLGTARAIPLVCLPLLSLVLLLSPSPLSSNLAAIQKATTTIHTTSTHTSMSSRQVVRETRFYVYNASRVYLNHMQLVSHDVAMILASELPTYEIYRTSHWIWFCDSTWYSANKQYVDPFLDWPETCYLKIAEWLGLALPPGSFDGGRRAVYVDPRSGFFAWAGGGNIGIGKDVFVSLPSWADVVIPHETTNMFTAEGVCGGWPTDWWANSRSPFPAMVAVKVEAFYNKPYWQQHDADDSNDPTYVMFKDLQSTYDWSLFQGAFREMNEHNVDLSQIRSEYEDPNWLSKGYLKSHYVAYYLSRNAWTDLSSTLNAGTVGKKPPGYQGTFYEYSISLASVRPTATIQSPVGWQCGTITLHATASDPDQHAVDVTFWYSRDRVTFYWIGIDQVESDGWSISWNTASSIPDVDDSVWAMCVSHDINGFESEWSVSGQFGVDNRPPVQITITSSPTGSGFVTVDGAALTTPQAFTWAQGSSHTLAANSPVSGGTGVQHVWVSWSDGGAQSHTITVPSSPTAYTANFKKQYMLTVSISPAGAGVLSASSGWRDDGTTIQVTATTNAGYSFYYWSLDGVNIGSSPSYSVLMNSPHSLAAFFRGTSTMSLGLSAESIGLGASVTLSGTITPAQPSPGIPVGTTVVLSYSLDGSTWNVFTMTQTATVGAYSIVWYPPYPKTYQIRATWSGNANYEGSTSSSVSLTVTGALPSRIALLVSGPTSTLRGSVATFEVLVTNPGPSTSATLYFEVVGPGGYWYFDAQQVSVDAGGTGRFQFAWQVPLTVSPGQYQVLVGLIPPKQTSISQTQITVT